MSVCGVPCVTRSWPSCPRAPGAPLTLSHVSRLCQFLGRGVARVRKGHFAMGAPIATPQQPDNQYWDDIASVAREAASTEEPLVYAGLRLLQRSGCSTPSRRLSKPPASPEKKTPAVHALEVRRAEDELKELLAQLERVEVAEARQAAHVIAMAGQRTEAQAATLIQAAFHGMMARAWCPVLRIERCERSAVLIQSAFHGYYARSQARASRRDALEQQFAATTIQAARHGQHARSFVREVRGTMYRPHCGDGVWATRI